MPSHRFHAGLVAVCLLLICLVTFAAGQDMPPAQPASSGDSTDITSQVPALRALPVEPGSGATGAASPDQGPIDYTKSKVFTYSVSLRESYDTNPNTSSNNSNSSGSFGTSISLSVLASRTFSEDSISASYTFDVTYYPNGEFNDQNTSINGSSGNGETLRMDHNLNVRETHTFSDRLSLTLADDATYSTEPDIYQNTGTPFNNGEHLDNDFNANLNWQATPSLNLSASYSNVLVKYNNQSVANDQNSIVQTVSVAGSVPLNPRINGNMGVSTSNADYTEADRGYVNTSIYGGAGLKVTPDLSVSANLGISYYVPELGAASFAPYVAASLNWQAGARTSVSLSYSHDISPSSQPGAQGEESDTVTGNASYVITPRLTASFEMNASQSSVLGSTNTAQDPVSQDELVYAFGPSLNYHFNTYLNFNAGLSITGNTSDVNDRQYARDEVYVGVRGTY